MQKLLNSNSFFLNQNHVAISKENDISFYSYTTFIACYNRVENILYLNSSKWDYSNTTRKYFKNFIEEFTPFDYLSKQKFIKFIESSENIIVLNPEGMIA